MTTEGRRYAGFWIRAIARIVDVLVIVAVYNLFYLVDRFGGDAGWWPPFSLEEGAPSLSAADALRGMFLLGFPVFYYVYLHGAYGQTFGKMALKLRVLGEDGTPIGYGKAFFRWLGYFVSGALTLGIGYSMAGFDRRKQALHDRICRTIVVREDDSPVSGPAAPKPPEAPSAAA